MDEAETIVGNIADDWKKGASRRIVFSQNDAIVSAFQRDDKDSVESRTEIQALLERWRVLENLMKLSVPFLDKVISCRVVKVNNRNVMARAQRVTSKLATDPSTEGEGERIIKSRLRGNMRRSDAKKVAKLLTRASTKVAAVEHCNNLSVAARERRLGVQTEGEDGARGSDTGVLRKEATVLLEATL